MIVAVIVGNVFVDLCEDINCGSNGDCVEGHCVCNTGYVIVENVCEETCESKPCKVSGNEKYIYKRSFQETPK